MGDWTDARVRALCCLAACATLGACLRKTEFKCTTDTDCSGGFCESTSFCSFADSECADGRRYGDFAGSLSNTCVGASMNDGGIDTPDSPPGDGGMGCPTDYAAISGGGTHLYKRLAASPWTSQRNACGADGTNVYLAIPDDMAETTGITTLSGVGLTWIGVRETSGLMFETVLGSAPTYVESAWDTANGEPNSTPGGPGCVAALMSSGLFETDRCNDSHVAVCECEP